MTGHGDRVAGEMPGPAVLPMPDESKLPKFIGRASRADYDSYFNLARTNPDLVRWSRSCLSVLQAQRLGLQDEHLSADDRLRIMHGMIIVLQVLVERWLEMASPTEEQDH
jgi:hypothetical protein